MTPERPDGPETPYAIQGYCDLSIVAPRVKFGYGLPPLTGNSSSLSSYTRHFRVDDVIIVIGPWEREPEKPEQAVTVNPNNNCHVKVENRSSASIDNAASLQAATMGWGLMALGLRVAEFSNSLL